MKKVKEEKEHSDMLLETKKRICELEKQQLMVYDPMTVYRPCDWENLRLNCILNELRQDSWITRQFCPYTKRLFKAVIRAELVVEALKLKAEITSKDLSAKIEWTSEELKRLKEAQKLLEVQK